MPFSTLSAAYAAGSDAALVTTGLRKTALSLHSLEDHVDDVGIALLAAPYAASLTGHGLSKFHNKKVKAFGNKLRKGLGVESNSPASHARELLGLALVAPSLTKGVARGLSKFMPKMGMAKEAIELAFNSPEEKAMHETRRNMVGTVAGVGGNLVGGHLGGLAGTAAGGPLGSVAGSLAGGYLGEQALAKPAQLAYDVQHDVRQRTGAGYNNAMGQLNTAAGLPAGSRL